MSAKTGDDNEAVIAACWASLAIGDLNAATKALAESAVHVARDLANGSPDYLLSSQDIEDAWGRVSKAQVSIGRARDALARAKGAGRG